MEQKITVLVTGAAGHLGTAVCRELVERGHRVRATDQRFRPGFPTPIEMGDLTDYLFVYRVLEGVDAVVHLGNHPNVFSVPARQKLLAENVAMNCNVFMAAVDLGIDNLVFSSSIQVLLNMNYGRPRDPVYLPYLPLDGREPPAPGSNAYAMSKEHAERLLVLLCEQRPQLSATALRFPMLPQEHWVQRLTAAPLPEGALNLSDAMTHMLLPDAARLVARVLERPRPGYHQYLPGRTTIVEGLSVQDIVREYYSHVPLKVPIDRIDSLVDTSELERHFDFVAEGCLRVRLAR